MNLESELQGVWIKYLAAYRVGDAHGCAALFSPDAQLMSPYAAVARGREAIEILHQEWTGDGAENKQIDMVEFGGSGDSAWCLVRFEEGAETGVGVSLNVLERTNGHRLIKVCSLNEDHPSTV